MSEVREFTEERRVRNELYMLDAQQLTDHEREWFYTHANDLCPWSLTDLGIARDMIGRARSRQEAKPKKRKGK